MAHIEAIHFTQFGCFAQQVAPCSTTGVAVVRPALMPLGCDSSVSHYSQVQTTSVSARADLDYRVLVLLSLHCLFSILSK